ncbi:hypothetical protein DNN94_23105 [Escherichia coli]|uniref:hypothetical protein n=1 Tax=Escherichia coli TaxID=562 RepID=UPI001594888A|nr:hypothetical protein [Escherichia coli]NVG84709.1 hypothetical protein [Escherichia coli]
MSQQQLPFTEPKLLEKLTRVKVQMKTQIAALQHLYGFGENEAAFYIEALLCEDKVTFFKPLADQAKITFLPWESDAFLGVEGNNPAMRPIKNRGWWRWLEDFRPDPNLEKHRFLFDPMANVFDVQRMREAVKKAKTGHKSLRAAWFKGFVPANPTSKKEPYITHSFERLGGWKPLLLTRGRLVAYRSPHLAFRDLFKLRTGNESFLAAPESVMRFIQGLDCFGWGAPTGLYDPILNEVTDRRPCDGKVKTKEKGKSGAGENFRVVPMELDHINRDQTDDRIINVRWVDRTMNLCNCTTARNKNRGWKNEFDALWREMEADGTFERERALQKQIVNRLLEKL